MIDSAGWGGPGSGARGAADGRRWTAGAWREAGRAPAVRGPEGGRSAGPGLW